jgi:hypothetical protein
VSRLVFRNKKNMVFFNDTYLRFTFIHDEEGMKEETEGGHGAD